MKPKEKAPSSPLMQLLGGGKKEPHKKVKHKKTVITSHTNGSHTVQHSPDSPDEVSYATPDLAGLKAGLDEHLGEAKPVEETEQ